MTKSPTRSAFTNLLLFAVIIIIRWTTIDTKLPPTWTPDSQIAITARLIQPPEHTDTKTIIKLGPYTVRFKGYKQLNIGHKYTFVGRVERKLLLGEEWQIVMIDPLYVDNGPLQLKPGEGLIVLITRLREYMVNKYQESLPEPHASLAAGILLGVKANIPYEFYQQLANSGTTHVIAASGYNVSIVASTVLAPLMKVMTRGPAVAIAVIIIGMYVLLAGASASVVRAAIMGSLTLIAYYWGRPAEAKRLLWVTAALMLFINPLMIGDAGFQLSVAATAGLLYIEPGIYKLLGGRKSLNPNIQAKLAEYVAPTLAASVATMPIILWTFGRVSWVSPVSNLLVLPTVPLIMTLAALALAAAWIPLIGIFVMWLLYVPLWWVVSVIRWLG